VRGYQSCGGHQGDRGTGQAVGVVADVGMFLDLLAKNMVQP
jgi:hypothetical protein